MLAYRSMSHFLFMIVMFVLFFSLPLQHADANMPKVPGTSTPEQFLVSVKPDTPGVINNKDKEKVNTIAEGSIDEPDTHGKNTSISNSANKVQDNTNGKDYNIKSDINDISTNVVESVSCDDLGMIPDDETKALDNYKILLAEAQKGTKIIVKGTYYLQSPYGPYSNENEVTAGLYLSGESSATSKLILEGNSFFKINGQALVENIYIDCPTSNRSYLFYMSPPFVNDITIRNNYITGNIKLIYSDVPSDFNFNAAPCRIENLTVEGNEFYDISILNGTRVAIYTVDTPVNKAFFRNNKVTNFSYVFYNNGITNGNPFTQFLKENNNAVIENNIVICADDYDAYVKSGNIYDTYYCFALIEGFSVQCRGNVFEGFHVSDAPDTLVYDNYFSVTKLLYENNTWKNNVNFTPGIQYVDIMKSKTATSVNGEKTERVYRGNTYIVEPDYADRFGKDRFLLRKEINTYLTDIDDIIIEDNYFDMYILSFRLQKFKELYKFNRNTVLMETIEHSLTSQAFAYIGEMKDESGSFIPRDFIFTNNTIICKSEPFGQATGTKMFSLIYDTTEGGDKTTVDFSNNKINVPGLEFIRSENRSYSDIMAAVNFKNNTITGIDTQPYLAILPSNQIN